MSGKPKNFSQAIEDLESHANSKVSDLRDRLKSELHHIEETLNNLNVGEEAKKAKDKVEEQVQKNPMAAIGIVGLIFFILGFLFAYKGSRKSD